jgi:acyl carrier protein
MIDKKQDNTNDVAMEKELLEIWRRALKKDNLTIDDDFFECGGDSLLATQVMMEFEELTGKSLEPSIVFETGTVRQLLNKIRAMDEIKPQVSSPRDPVNGKITQIARVVESPGEVLPIPSSASVSWKIKNILHKTKSFIVGKSTWLAPVSPSYEMFLRFQKFWISLPPVQFHFLLRKKILVFKQWVLLTGQIDHASDLMTRNLMANTWFAIREFFMAQPKTFERWVKLSGMDHLQQAAAQKRGVILVIPHTRAFFPSMRDRIAAGMFTESIYLGSDFLPPKGVERMILITQLLQECRDVLARGGAVWVAGDGMTGTMKISPMRFGRHFPFRAGAAELAVQTGAPLVPVFPSLYADGHIEVEFLEPLTPRPKQSKETSVDDLLRDYAEIYMDRWPRMLPSMTFLWQKNRLNDVQ